MSASEALNPQQFVHHSELAKMYSADFDVPMSRVLPEMRQQDHYALSRDPDGRHPSYKTRQDSPGSHVAALAKDIKANGMREPIEVRGGNVVTDGHHRALAAMRNRMERVPVRHVQ